jgi:hypothetical protein
MMRIRLILMMVDLGKPPKEFELNQEPFQRFA